MAYVREYIWICDNCGVEHDGKDENFSRAKNNALNDGWKILKDKNDGEYSSFCDNCKDLISDY